MAVSGPPKCINLSSDFTSKRDTGSLMNPKDNPGCRRFEQICQLADVQVPQPTQKGRGKPQNSKGRNLLNRLTSHRDAWLTLAFVPDVPFTNDQAERDIRHLKIKQKVATNFQTFKGAQHHARIQSFSSTLRKHSMNVFPNFIKILDGERISFQVG